MDWTITIEGQDFRLQLPSNLPAGEVFTIHQNSKQYLVTWEPILKSLFVREILKHGNLTSKLERCLAFRCQQIQNYGNEIRIDLTVRHFAGGISAQISPTAATALVRQNAGQVKGVMMRSPITGRILKILVEQGQTVGAGEAVMIIEAMKMENRIFAPQKGLILELKIQPGIVVQTGAPLLYLQYSS